MAQGNKYDVVVIGAGIVGLASALQLQRSHPELRIAVIDKEADVAAHQTGHNSGVIHSGIYYKPGSAKARNCKEGYDLMLEFLKAKELPFELCGKVIVATDEWELPALEEIERRGKANGLEGLKRIGKEEIREREPYLNGISAIMVPQSGITNYALVCRAMQVELEENGVEFYLGEAVIDWKPGRVETEKSSVEAALVINCAGLYSDRIAEMRLGKLDMRIIPFRGEYYELKPEAEHLVKHLIYPVPDPSFPFLGVHFTRMVQGGIEAGPNAVFALAREGYTWGDINLKELGLSLGWPGFRKLAAKYWKTGLGEMHRSLSKAAFTKALQRLVPELKESDLVRAESGVRAQACWKDGGLVDDFVIREQAGEIHVLNAPSPAATSSLAIGKHVASLALKQIKE